MNHSEQKIVSVICLDYDMIVIEFCFTVIQLKMKNTEKDVDKRICEIIHFLSKYMNYADDIQMFRDIVLTRLRHLVKVFPILKETIESEIDAFNVWC